MLSRNEILVKVAEVWNMQCLVEDESLGDTPARLFHDTPLRPLVDKLKPQAAIPWRAPAHP